MGDDNKQPQQPGRSHVSQRRDERRRRHRENQAAAAAAAAAAAGGAGAAAPPPAAAAPPPPRADPPPPPKKTDAELGARPKQPQRATVNPRRNARAAARGAAERGVDQAAQQLAGMDIGKTTGNGSNGNGNGNGNGGPGKGKGDVQRGNIRGGGRRLQPMEERGSKKDLKPENFTTKINPATDSNTVNLVANYFEFSKNEDWKLYLYHVDFLPELDVTFKKKQLLRTHKEKDLQCDYIFDGQALFTTKRIKHIQKVKETVTLRGIIEEDKKKEYEIKLTLIKEVNPLDHIYIQILNIIIRRCQEFMGLKLMGRNYYDQGDPILDHKYNLKIWPGYITSIRGHEKSILMCADVSHKFVRNDTALDYLRELRNAGGDFDPILGSVVCTKYNEKTYRVDSVTTDSNPMSTFRDKGGNDVRYYDYYKDRYNIVIKDRGQPMLVSIRKDKDRRRGDFDNVMLVPELCVMTGLSDSMRNDFTLMKHFADYTKVGPQSRYNSLMKLNRRLKNTEQVKTELQNWKLTIAPDLLRIKGKLLPQEKIVQGSALTGKRAEHDYNRFKSDWTSITQSNEMNENKNLNMWAVIYPERSESVIRNFVSIMTQVAQRMNMRITTPKTFALRSDSTGDYVRTIQSNENFKKCNLIMILLSNQRGDKYSSIKRFITCELGVPSQFLIYKTISNDKRVRSVATKVAIQICAKMGGEIWSVPMPMKNTMIVGFDTYHDSKNKKESFGALVASYNKTCTKYFGTVTRHERSQELTDNFNMSLTLALDNYHKFNQFYPDKIMVYRDGVGDSQIDYVKEIEIVRIKDVLKEMKKKADKDIQLTFIIVSKRINSKFMMFDRQKNLTNPIPGTVVDEDVTLPERYDFFLISQSVNQGTVNPTSFNVIEDWSGLTPEQMQRIAYKLCHLYYNWSGTVRVPAPCQYAHKLAYMSGTATHDFPSRRLEHLLWYL